MAILFLICCALAIGGACLGTLGMASDRALYQHLAPRCFTVALVGTLGVCIILLVTR